MNEAADINQNNLINLDNLIKSANELIDLLRQENNYLLGSEIDKLEKLQDQKSTIINTIVSFQESLKNNEKTKKYFDKDKINQIKILQNELTNQIEENLKKISISTEVNHEILNSIQEIIVKESKRQSGYNNAGTYGNKFKSNNEVPIFSSIDYI